jgi:hypothetical protein
VFCELYRICENTAGQDAELVNIKPFCAHSKHCFKWLGAGCSMQVAGEVRTKHFIWMNSKGGITACSLKDYIKFEAWTQREG